MPRAQRGSERHFFEHLKARLSIQTESRFVFGKGVQRDFLQRQVTSFVSGNLQKQLRQTASSKLRIDPQRINPQGIVDRCREHFSHRIDTLGCEEIFHVPGL